MPQVVTCPQCATSLRVPDTFPPGAKVKCPKCATPFPVPSAGDAADPAPVSVKPMDPPPMSPPAMDEGIGGAPPSFSSGGPAGLESLSPNYKVDISALFGEISKHYGALLGPLIGFILIFAVIVVPLAMISGLIGLIPLLGSLISGVMMSTLVPQLSAGAYYATLKQMRGQPWSFGDCFAGFRFWVPLFIVGAITQFVYWLCFLPMSVVTFGFQLMQDPRNPDPTMAMVSLALMLVLGLIGLLAYVFVSIRYLVLAPYLVIDANLNGIDAIKGNAILAQGHFGQWFVAMLLAVLLGMVGVVACGVGALFTMPMMFILMTGLYLQAIRGSRSVAA